jgi:hypothetical protein
MVILPKIDTIYVIPNFQPLDVINYIHLKYIVLLDIDTLQYEIRAFIK